MTRRGFFSIKIDIFDEDQCLNMEGYRNPGIYFEIPVTDMERAVRFYSQTFNFSFEREKFDGNHLFPCRKCDRYNRESASAWGKRVISSHLSYRLGLCRRRD